MIVIQCDEHIKRSVREGLRMRGIEVWSIEEEQLKGVSDNELLTFCIKNKRILLTNDEDFFTLTKNTHHAGIIFITDQHAPVGTIIRTVLRLVYTVKEDEFKDSILYVP